MSSSARRVVITGMGIVSPLGLTPESLWAALDSGQSGVGPIDSFSTRYLPTTFAAEARQFTGAIDDFGTLEAEKKKAIRKGLKVMCRESQMGVAAAQRAIADAAMPDGSFDPERVGVVFGSDYMVTLPEDFTAGVKRCLDADGKFDFSLWATEGMPQITPLWLLKYLPNMPASHVAIYNDLRGPNNSITLREASGNLAIGEAFRTIVRSSADAIVAGATGTRIHPTKAVHALLQEEVAGNGVDPAKASRPFDLDRTGMVLGEGAGCVVLEELEYARARGARIYAEVVGTASSSVADEHGVANRTLALTNVMRAALRDAGIDAAALGHVHAHGLSTRTSDAEESAAIAAVFGQRKQPIPVTAAKSYFGNLGAASGVIELVASILALEHRSLFPILNLEKPDPECPIYGVTSKNSDPGSSFINVNVTPQGQASAVVIRSLV